MQILFHCLIGDYIFFFLIMLSLQSVAGLRCFSRVTPLTVRLMCSEGGGRFVENISSASNVKVKLLKSLSIKKKRDDLKLVLAEGHRLVLDALKAGAIPHYVMYSDKAFDSPLKNRLQDELRSLPRSCSISRGTDSILGLLTDTVSNQGLVAAFEKPANFKEDQNALGLTKITEKDNPLTVILDKVRDPGNMGTLLRSCFGLGASSVVAVDACDVWSSKVMRSAMGVQLTTGTVMPIVELFDWRDLYDVLGEYESAQHEMQIVVADGSAGSIPYYDIDFTLPTALVIGSEADGASASATGAPGRVVRACIPMQRNLESFNAAVAGSVLLAEAARQRGAESSHLSL